MILKVRASMIPDSQDCMRRAASNQYTDLLSDAGYEFSGEKRIGAYAPVGVGAHAAGEFILTSVIENGFIPSVNNSIQHAISVYETEFKKYDMVEFDDIIYSKDAGIDHVKRFARVYAADVAPRMRFPEGAKPKEHLELYLKNIYRGFEISGHVDVYTGRSICDTKTGKTVKSHQSQLGCYGLLLGEENFEGLVINHLPRVGLDKKYPGSKIIKYNKGFSLKEAFRGIDRIIDCVEKFKKDGRPESFPANPSSYICTKKYCKCYGTSFCEYRKE